MDRRRALGLSAGALLGSVLPALAEGETWEIVTSSGREYVTFTGLEKFYGFQRQTKGDHVWLSGDHYVLKAKVGSQEILINETKFILSFPVLRSGTKVLLSKIDLAKLVDPVLRPAFIRSAKPFKRVVIDPGHGGDDTGATGGGVREKDLSLRLGKHFAEKLRERGFEAVMTRETDRFIDLGARAEFANKVDSSIFISLHFNHGTSGARGIETYALSPYGTKSTMDARPGASSSQVLSGNERDGENIALATAVHASVLNKIQTIDRGIKRARWAVLTHIERPAVLFEGGFVTHPVESREIASDAYQLTVADALARAVSNFRRAVAG